MSKQIAYRANCNGNSFSIIFRNQLTQKLTPQFIQFLCGVNTKEKVDGLLMVDTDIKDYDFRMDYYNNDGTWETMCGNGALCVVQLLNDKKFIFKKNKFISGDGEHKIEYEEKIKIQIKSPSLKTKSIHIENHIGAHVDSGAKHFVTPLKIKKNLYNIAKNIRYSDEFQPEGINVNFFSVIDPNNIDVVTYEKGIEQIMNSCATGSVACIYYASLHQEMHSPVTSHSRGGNMVVEFNSSWKEVWISSNPKIEIEREY